MQVSVVEQSLMQKVLVWRELTLLEFLKATHNLLNIFAGQVICVGYSRMNLIILVTVATVAKGNNCQLTNAPNGGSSKFIQTTQNCANSKFIQTATGFRVLSWLRQLSSSLPSHPHCPAYEVPSQTSHTWTNSSLLFPPLHRSLSSCLHEPPSGPLSSSALFGLAQGVVRFHLPEDRVAVARVHLGKLVSPVVLWGGTGVTKVIQCQEEEKEELWVWDRRALETLRYSDSERQLNMVNFDGGWYAWGEKRSEEIEQQVGTNNFQKAGGHSGESSCGRPESGEGVPQAHVHFAA